MVEGLEGMDGRSTLTGLDSDYTEVLRYARETRRLFFEAFFLPHEGEEGESVRDHF
jgi:hypothetical protein